ncbi:protein cramped [Chelonus insularis]|uniref:protein cramped n=1 Tax=Chelonus insularis TaxID=460826 RepID=UPI00158E2F37|nr:protein cramped [Chelonus insularis]XP_034948919.1 protein cramped [Chelonus insularis]XP_034948920.1 protein cramped [Chelonus insularis]
MDKEDESPNYSNTSTKKDESIPLNLDTKTTIDAKNSQSKIVRGTKKMRIDSTDCNQAIEKKENTKEEEGDTKIVRSLKRSCELWSLEDKNTFFKAVNEYGKDFDALQSYFLNQGKKKGLPENMIKNKEQIRHFYYRTWLKISKHLKFSEDVKKTSQELYGLINYGELRRKLPRIHEKFLLKLNELIYWGSTQVRLRGKTMRIKTPICRALRKLNQLEDWQEEIKLPSRVTVELRPGNNLTWWKVQANAMNPRVRTLVPIQRRLSSLLMFLSQRWKSTKFKPLSNIDGNTFDEKKYNDNELLRVTPMEGAKIALPVVNLGEYLTSNSVSLNSYEKRLGLKSSHAELLGYVQQFKSVGKKTIKKKTDKKLTTVRGSNDDTDKKDDNNSDLDNLDTHLNCLDKSLFTCHVDKPTNDNNSTGGGASSSTGTNNEPNRFPGRETVDRIRVGWNIDEANTITIGDLFLMFGRDSKITLEYWWDVGTKENDRTVTGNPLKNMKKQEESLSIALQKLLSIAKHNYGSSKAFDNTLSSNETVISSRMPSIRESTFRRPLIPQVIHKMGSQDAFKTQLDKFTTRFCKRGRVVRPRNLIVQRTIPIMGALNRTDGNEINSKININEIMGKKIRDQNDESEQRIRENEADKLESTDEEDQNFLSSIVDNSADVSAEQPSNSIITSATQILKEGEGQWLNSEVADYSLSSFLGQFESPIKGSQRSQTGIQLEPIRSSSDVVNPMQCLMVENSVDYMAKFANLASQIVSDEENK